MNGSTDGLALHASCSQPIVLDVPLETTPDGTVTITAYRGLGRGFSVEPGFPDHSPARRGSGPMMNRIVPPAASSSCVRYRRSRAVPFTSTRCT